MTRLIWILLVAGAAWAQNGSMRGVVGEKGSQTPVRKAMITARAAGPAAGSPAAARPGPPKMYQVATNDEGAFAVPDLAPGKYYLTVEKQGYIAQNLGN